jgi:hypothetical protein
MYHIDGDAQQAARPSNCVKINVTEEEVRR